MTTSLYILQRYRGIASNYSAIYIHCWRALANDGKCFLHIQSVCFLFWKVTNFSQTHIKDNLNIKGVCIDKQQRKVLVAGFLSSLKSNHPPIYAMLFSFLLLAADLMTHFFKNFQPEISFLLCYLFPGHGQMGILGFEHDKGLSLSFSEVSEVTLNPLTTV